MKHIICLYLILLNIAPISVSSQKVIKGVVTSDDGHLLDGAIVKYGIDKKERLFTDKEGQFVIPDLPERVIYIEYSGFSRGVTLLSTLRKNPIVILEPEPVELASIEIDGISARTLLQKAAYNTKRKMQTGKPLSYLTHVVESEEINNEKREFYFTYAALLEKTDPGKRTQSYKFWLQNLKHIHTLPENSLSKILKGKKMSSNFHLSSIGVTVSQGNRYIQTESADMTLLKIESIQSKDEGLKYFYYINKSDTTFNSMHMESVDSIMDKRRYKKLRTLKYRLEKATSDIKINKKDGFYYFDKATYSYQYSFLMGDKEERVTYYVKTGLSQSEPNVDKRKPIKNKIKDLYDELDTTNRPFWDE